MADPVLDPNTGLQYDNARFYDPTTGQFLSVDPLVQQTGQPYSYANSNPITNTDPSGECSGLDEDAADAADGVTDAAEDLLSDGLATIGEVGEDAAITAAICGGDGTAGAAAAAPEETVPGMGEDVDENLLPGGSENPGCLVTEAAEDAGAGALLPIAGGAPADDINVSEILQGKLGSIQRAPLPPGSPSLGDIGDMTLAEVRAAAQANEPGFKTILKLLTDNRFNKP